MVALWVLITLAAVTVKLAEVDPLATVTDDGSVKFVLLLLSVTAEPPLGAAPLKLTVQVEVAGVVIVDGLQLTELRMAGLAPAAAALKATVVAANVAELWFHCGM